MAGRTTPFHFIFLLVLAFATIANASDVRLGDPVYDFLQRCEIQGYVDEPLPGAQPYSRRLVAERLVEIGNSWDDLSAVEQEQLKYYALKFQYELRDRAREAPEKFTSFWAEQDLLPGWLFENGWDALTFYGQDDVWMLALNPSVRAEYYDRPREAVGDGVVGGRILSYGGALRFAFDRWTAAASVTDSQIRFTSDETDSVRYPYHYSAASDELWLREFDFYDFSAEVAYENDYVLLWFGRNRQRWAGGESGSLVIDDTAQPYTHFRFKARLRPFELTMTQARLQTEPRIVTSVDSLGDGGIRQHYAKKWMAANRLEVFIHDKVRIGFFQQIFYGQRDFDIEYLNPLIFMQAAEHYSGDPDNLLIGADLRVLLARKLSLNLQVLLDEFTLSKIGSDNNENKWAFLLNGRYVDPMGIPNSQLWAEYVRIRPFVYTHRFPINKATHLSTGIGYPMQPNSERILVGWKQQFSRSIRADLTLEQRRHGQNPPGMNLGGNIDLAPAYGAPDNVETLGGDLLTVQSVSATIQVEPLTHLHFLFGLTYIERSLDPLDGGSNDENLVLIQTLLQWYPVF